MRNYGRNVKALKLLRIIKIMKIPVRFWTKIASVIYIVESGVLEGDFFCSISPVLHASDDGSVRTILRYEIFEAK